MSFNFRKSISIFPGVKVNITKNGVSSVTVGKRGAKVTKGKRGTQITVGIPGTGMSYTKKIKKVKNNA